MFSAGSQQGIEPAEFLLQVISKTFPSHLHDLPSKSRAAQAAEIPAKQSLSVTQLQANAKRDCFAAVRLAMTVPGCL
jgi:hypothetical protein